MTDLVKVRVLRSLGGYVEGAEREVSAADAARLESRGVVQRIKAKADRPVENKMDTTPDNKSGLKRKAK